LKTYDPDPPKSHVMPVIEDHPDYAVCYCEMCGAEIDKGGDAINSGGVNRFGGASETMGGVNQPGGLSKAKGDKMQGGAHNDGEGANVGDLLRLVGAMSRWTIHKPVYMRVLASRIVSPHYTIRELGQVVGLNKSQVHTVMVAMAKDYPVLNTILGFRSTRSRGQTNRRNKEKAT
jgi:hypothetical protein